MGKQYNFDAVLDRTALSTAKWEQEFARLGNTGLLAFGTADMDFRSAQPIIDALTAAAQRGHFGYPYKGDLYYGAVTDYFKRKFDWAIEKSWIQTATGVYASLSPIVEELTDPGDEIIFQTPAHHIFEESVRALKRVPLENPLKVIGGHYSLDIDDLESKITPRTKILLFCNPHNPTGRVWTREELEAVQEVCVRRGVIVLSDEIYSGLLYRGAKFTPMASISHTASMNTITLASASKSFNTTGLKHSLVIAENEGVRDAFLRGQRRSNMYYGGSIFGQIATEVAFRDCDDWSEQLMQYVEENGKLATEMLGEILPDAYCYQPQSTYFLWVDMSAYQISSRELVRHFEERANITVTSGHLLGTGGDRHIRLNLGCPRCVLVEGLKRIRAAGVPLAFPD